LEENLMGKKEDAAKENVIKRTRDQNIKFIRLWFTDILGFLKSFSITAEQLEEALNDGMGFDGSSIQGFARIDESDMIALPDPNTYQAIPWRPKEQGVARMFCDIYWPGGQPFEGDPRYILKKNLKRATDL
jgi:glutamine synthetase